MTINKTTTDLSTLKINYLTQEMYEDALENEEINENELYITPGSGGGGSDSVFVAEYGVTSYSNLVDAIDANKVIVVLEGATEYEVVTSCWYDSSKVVLSWEVSTYSVSAIVSSSNTWSSSSTILQTQLISGTNIKTINNTSILGNGDISVAVGGTSTPTADEVAEFDSTAHMNSTDMTSQEVSDFVGNLGYSFNLIDMFYPVGSYYETSDSTFNPNITWGGTWVLETEGQVHVSAGETYEVGDTGGAETVTLDTTMIPAHTHGSKTVSYSFRARRQGANYQSTWGVSNVTVSANSSGVTSNGVGTTNQNSDQVDLSASHTHDSVGGGQAHENMPPYIVVNRWHRTA